ncbi:MAG: hypothetical protein JO251_13775 [Verrucomicrobia bacterium]|nr:hypothetical protein [Verrucomicrobiota bacterium]
MAWPVFNPCEGALIPIIVAGMGKRRYHEPRLGKPLRAASGEVAFASPMIITVSLTSIRIQRLVEIQVIPIGSK